MGCSLTGTELGVTIPRMKASRDKFKTAESEPGSVRQEGASGFGAAADDGIDLSLLEDSLAKTPWERMQANDDASRFADSLRAALTERDAKSE
jgi:hypothetical protein